MVMTPSKHAQFCACFLCGRMEALRNDKKYMQSLTHFLERLPYIGHAVAVYPWADVALVLGATIIAAWVVQHVIIRALRFMTRHTQTELDDRIIAALQRPLFYTVIIGGVMSLALLAGVADHTRHITVALAQTLLVFLWARFFFQLIKVVLYRSKDVPHITFVQEQTLPLFENLLAVVVVAGALYAIFSIWGINMTAWLASAGIVGMAFGFAAKDTLANLFSGVFILADAPYKIGDYIELDSGERGRVTHIGIRSTRMLTRDDVEVTVPNGIMGNTKIVNESGGPYEKFRVRIDVSVAYGSDIDRVEAELLAAAHDVDLVVDEPAARVRFRAFGDSGLEYVLFYWVPKPEQRGESRHLVNRAIYQRFAAAGIHIPFPQRDVHIRER